MPVMKKRNTKDDLSSIVDILDANIESNKNSKNMPVYLSVIIGPREQMQKLYESLDEQSGCENCIYHDCKPGDDHRCPHGRFHTEIKRTNNGANHGRK